MTRGRYSAQNFLDLAAFIGNPLVPSPDLRLQTRGQAASAFSNERLDFGALQDVATSSTSVVRIENQGQVAVRLGSAPIIAGDHAAHFEAIANDCKADRVLQLGEGCEISIVFRAVGGAGARSASVYVSHDWIGGRISVALLGAIRSN